MKAFEMPEIIVENIVVDTAICNDDPWGGGDWETSRV